MLIQQIDIHHFRNLTHITLAPTATFNVLFGLNGSGKTSFLESIFFLSLGRSFRTRIMDSLIQNEKERFSIFAQLGGARGTIPLGVERLRGGEKRARLDGQEVRSHIELAQLLPLLLISADENQLISSGPLLRRQFINWGMFHVEPDFYRCWQRLQQVLKQRNVLLKRNKLQREELIPWDRALLSVSTDIDVLRKAYIETLLPYFNQFIGLLLKEIPEVTLTYFPGWREDQPLEDVLEKSFLRDKFLGYTQYGPHRMDMLIKVDHHLAKEVLSRGQQKLLIYALKLAQGMLLYERKEKRCIYLIDDLMSELDKSKQSLVLSSLSYLSAQVFITNVEHTKLDCIAEMENHKLFHVEQGSIVDRVLS